MNPVARGRHYRSARLVVTVVMALFAVYIALPLYWLLVATTKSNDALLTSFGFWFSGRFELFANIGHVFTLDKGVFARWLLNTVLYAGAGGLLATALAAGAGYGFACFRFRGRQLLFYTVLVSLMVPFTALAIPTYLMDAKVSLINDPLAVILPAGVSPVGVYLLRVYTEAGLPKELLDAARVDGAGELTIFFRVVMPIIRPACATVLLLTVVATWNNYFLPLLVLSRNNVFPLTVGLSVLNSQAAAGEGHQIIYTVIVTGGLIGIAPLIVLFVVLQRYWRSGLVLGSLAGT